MSSCLESAGQSCLRPCSINDERRFVQKVSLLFAVFILLCTVHLSLNVHRDAFFIIGSTARDQASYLSSALPPMDSANHHTVRTMRYHKSRNFDDNLLNEWLYAWGRSQVGRYVSLVSRTRSSYPIITHQALFSSLSVIRNTARRRWSSNSTQHSTSATRCITRHTLSAVSAHARDMWFSISISRPISSAFHARRLACC